LFEGLRKEGLVMPYTVEDMERDAMEMFLGKATVEQKLKGMSPEDLLKGLSPEARAEMLRLLQARATEEGPRP